MALSLHHYSLMTFFRLAKVSSGSKRSFASLVLQEEWSAATAACLVIRTEVFDRVVALTRNSQLPIMT